MTTKEQLRLSRSQSILAGCIAGCVTRSCTSPLDVLKIIFQVRSTTTCSVPKVVQSMNTNVQSSIATTCRTLYLTEGIQGFWKGNIAGCCRLGPYSGLKFFIFDDLQTRFCSDKKPSNIQCAGFGALAGMIATLSCYPMEVVRTKMILQSPRRREITGVLQGISYIYRQQGLRGLYQGGLSGLVGSIPFEGVQFACYEYCKSYAAGNQWPAWRWENGKNSLNTVDYLVIGSISGAVAQTISYPFDSVKKRLQAQHLGKSGKQYKGMLDCFETVIKEEGPLALYRGTIPNMARIAPYAAVMFTTYEAVKKMLLS